MKRIRSLSFVLSCFFLTVSCLSFADDLDEFKIKRTSVFEFTEKPSISRKGDRVTIRFTSKGFCDATVVIERKDGRIIRHLASGVLGPDVPAPFEKNSLEQNLVWDGKDDFGRYVDKREDIHVRVSLGLKPQFERTLFWSPKRRHSRYPQLACAAEEGVYVYEGGRAGFDQVLLFDHDGNYIKTVYPFAADKINEVKGLKWRTALQDGSKQPVKTNFLQTTMLTSGLSGSSTRLGDWGKDGPAATVMAVQKGMIALAQLRLNRLGTGGATAGLELEGPTTKVKDVYPRSAALSPDGTRLYLTAYIGGRMHHASQDIRYIRTWNCIPVVTRLDLTSGKKMDVFKGRIASGAGKDDIFKLPSSVDVDAKGRVYVTDHIRDAVIVFSPRGKELKRIPVKRPARVCVHRKSGDIYVFSWKVMNAFDQKFFKGSLHRFGNFDNPIKKKTWPLHKQMFRNYYNARYCPGGHEFYAELDSWVKKPTFWMTTEGGLLCVANRGTTYGNIEMLTLEKNGLKVKRLFAADVKKTGIPGMIQAHHRQRIYVNPKNRRLYLAEGDGTAAGKSFALLREIDPETGAVRTVDIPFNAEDMCFDLKGLAYLRTVNRVARYDPSDNWREVPWDYGEELSGVGFGWMGPKRAKVVSAIVMPADANWHHGGMHISAKGNLAVACGMGFSTQVKTNAKYKHHGGKYRPKIYPGRLVKSRCGCTCIHVWDRHGKMIYEDAVPGFADLYGVGIDADDSIYVMSGATRILNGTPYPNRWSGTVIKGNPGTTKVLTRGKGTAIALSKERTPNRTPDIKSAMQGTSWVESAEWLYGGVGFGGKNGGNGCACSNYRFALDYLDRVFAPELDLYSIAVLDSSGNLITRIGTYGNVDDGKPLIPAGGPSSSRSIGGDEVALFHGAYLAADTDHRLFIADSGNDRVLSVKLGYHAQERIPLAKQED